jgi:sulfite exporter TauE/SafE/copper chaperone CopZ
MQKAQIQIEGTHCQACKARIESGVARLTGVRRVNVNWKTGKSWVEFDDGLISREKIESAIEELGYPVRGRGSQQRSVAGSARLSQRLILGGVLLVLIVAGYLLVDRSGAFQLMARLNEGNLSYGLIFIIGLLASFHCVGMCGGLVVTYTATCSANDQQGRSFLPRTGRGMEYRPHLQYNLGRLISYTAVGAVLGGFGSFFGVSLAFTSALTLVVGVLMIVMGLSFLTEWKWLRGIEVGPLSRVARFLYGQQGRSGSRAPLLIGLLNGFMPCGPLQAMQLYALASGSVTKGALAMAVYALGTAPLMFGFGSALSLLSRERVNSILRVSGAVVIVLGLLMVNRGLANFIGSRAASPSTPAPVAAEQPTPGAVSTQPAFQTVRMAVTSRGYEPDTLQVKEGVPVRWVIDGQQLSGCTNEIILPEYNIRKKLQPGENVIEFTPTREGVIRFSCWMKMVWGKFVVSKFVVNAN